MTRDEARQLLQDGVELDGLALSKHDLVLARGKVKWVGTTWSASETGTAVGLMLRHGRDQLRVPLVEPVTVHKGGPLEIQFGPKWQRRGAA